MPIVSKYMGEMKRPLLDAACGFGNPYLDKLHLNKMVGMDIDPTVKDRNKLHQEFIIGDLHYLNTERRFEGIISVNTWEHLHSPELVLENFFKVLSNQGVLIIIAPPTLELYMCNRTSSSKIFKGYCLANAKRSQPHALPSVLQALF